jgi:hypothetical protein
MIKLIAHSVDGRPLYFFGPVGNEYRQAAGRLPNSLQAGNSAAA